jgi:hypothetical protein
LFGVDFIGKYVLLGGDRKIDIMDAASDQIVKTLPLATSPDGICDDQEPTSLYPDFRREPPFFPWIERVVDRAAGEMNSLKAWNRRLTSNSEKKGTNKPEKKDVLNFFLMESP